MYLFFKNSYLRKLASIPCASPRPFPAQARVHSLRMAQRMFTAIDCAAGLERDDLLIQIVDADVDVVIALSLFSDLAEVDGFLRAVLHACAA